MQLTAMTKEGAYVAFEFTDLGDSCLCKTADGTPFVGFVSRFMISGKEYLSVVKADDAVSHRNVEQLRITEDLATLDFAGVDVRTVRRDGELVFSSEGKPQ